MFKSHNLFLNKISDEMMSYVNVLGPAMLNRILGNIYCTQIVNVLGPAMLEHLVQHYTPSTSPSSIQVVNNCYLLLCTQLQQ